MLRQVGRSPQWIGQKIQSRRAPEATDGALGRIFAAPDQNENGGIHVGMRFGSELSEGGHRMSSVRDRFLFAAVQTLIDKVDRVWSLRGENGFSKGKEANSISRVLLADFIGSSRLIGISFDFLRRIG